MPRNKHASLLSERMFERFGGIYTVLENLSNYAHPNPLNCLLPNELNCPTFVCCRSVSSDFSGGRNPYQEALHSRACDIPKLDKTGMINITRPAITLTQQMHLSVDSPVQPLSGWFKRLREGKGKAGHRRWYQIRGRVLSSYKKKVIISPHNLWPLSCCKMDY